MHTLESSLESVVRVYTKNSNINAVPGDGFKTDGDRVYYVPIPDEVNGNKVGDETLTMTRVGFKHEMGHCLHTDFDKVKQQGFNQTSHFIWNALEDVRIEKLNEKKWPGHKRERLELFKTFIPNRINKEFNNPQASMLQKIGKLLYLRATEKRIGDLGLQPPASLQRLLDEKCGDLMDRIVTTESGDEIIDIAKEIYKRFGDMNPPKPQPQKSDKDEGEPSDSEDVSDEQSGQADDKDEDSGTEQSGSDESDEDEDNENAEGTGSGDSEDDEDGEDGEDGEASSGDSEDDEDGDSEDGEDGEASSGDSEDGEDGEASSGDSEDGEDGEASSGDSEDGEDGETSSGDSEDGEDGETSSGDAGSEDDSEGNNPANEGDGGTGGSDSGGPDEDDDLKDERKELAEDVEQDQDGDSVVDDIEKEVEKFAGENNIYRDATGLQDDIRRVDGNVSMVKMYEQDGKKLAGTLSQLFRRLFISSRAPKTRRHQKDGRLDLRKLWNDNSETVFTRTMRGTDEDSAVSLVIDNSSSMRESSTVFKYSKAYLASSMLAYLASELDKLRIPFEACGFTTISGYGGGVMVNGVRHTPILINQIKKFSEPYRAVRGNFEFPAHAKGTVELPCVKFAAERLLKRKESKKILFILSDGQTGAHDMLPALQQYIKDLIEKKNVKVIGFGINSDGIKQYCPHSVQVTPQGLSKEVYKELIDVLVKGA